MRAVRSECIEIFSVWVQRSKSHFRDRSGGFVFRFNGKADRMGRCHQGEADMQSRPASRGCRREKGDTDRSSCFLQVAVESRQRETSPYCQFQVSRVVRGEFLNAGKIEALIEGKST